MKYSPRFNSETMARKRLTEKLKQEIKANPYKVKYSELSESALQYVKRVKAARKGVKTKQQKAVYKKPQRRSQGKENEPEDILKAIAKNMGMSYKSFRKKHNEDEVKEFVETGKLTHARETDLLLQDIRFAGKGVSIYVNGRKVSRPNAILAIARFKNKVMSTGLTYERMGVEYSIDAKGGIRFSLPSSDKLNKFEDSDEMLEYIEDAFPIFIYRK